MNIVSTSFKAFALVTLLSGISAVAMDNKTVVVSAPAVIKVEPAVVTPVVVEPIAPVVVKSPKKECALTCAISKKWNKFSNSVAAKKNDIVACFKDMKARGWSNWTTNEKTAVVVGGTVVVAAVTYAAYKLYQSLTAPQIKVKSGVRVVRIQ